MKTASARLTGARVSPLKSVVLLDKLRNRNIAYAKTFLNHLLDETESLNGKQYTKTAQVILNFLESAEANAKQKNMNIEKLFIKTVSASKGEKTFKGKTRWRLRGRKAKVTNMDLVLEER